jgi:CBS domain-containing protein
MALRIDEAGGLTVADVTHSRFSVLGPAATVGDAQAWFDDSTSHCMALLADDGRFLGFVLPDDVAGADPGSALVDYVRREPTVAPGEPAARGEEIALRTDARRVPVVDDDGRLLGIVAVTKDLQGFCGAGGTEGC